MASALPVIVGVESFVTEEEEEKVGAFGAVVSEEELELEGEVPLLPGNVDFPANDSGGIKNKKPNVERKTAVL